MKKIIVLLFGMILLINLVSATDYYFSQSGDDTTGDGSITTPFKTITKANTVCGGNTCYFNGGDKWLVGDDTYFQLSDNTRYTSYGNGKAEFWGGINASSQSNWSNGGGGNIWNSTFTSPVEVQVFYNNSASNKSSSYIGLDIQGEHYYDTITYKISIYSTSNPATFYSLVITGQEYEIFHGVNDDNVEIDNFIIRYGGSHAIAFNNVINISIHNNTIEWIGGTYQSGTTRYGNCIQTWDNSTNVFIYNNYIGYCYDAGISPQSTNCGKTISNQLYYNNVLYNNRYHIEIFNWIGGCSGNYGRLENISVHHNTLVYSGTNDFRVVDGKGILLSVAPPNTSNISFIDNIFSNSDYREIELEGTGNHYNWMGDYPVFNYNLYNNNGTNYIRWENDYYSNITSFYTGQGMELNGLQGNPLFVSGYYQPAYNSPACSMSSTGGFVGALPCADAPVSESPFDFVVYSGFSFSVLNNLDLVVRV